MGCVDLTNNFAMARNWLKKYYMKIFCQLMDMHSLNACHVQRKLKGKKKQLMFLIELDEKLIEKYSNPHPTASIGKP
jgi:hypothetical protein